MTGQEKQRRGRWGAAVAAGLLAALAWGLGSARSWAVERSPRLALVIGNAAYADAALRNPLNDARDVAARLKALGFAVIVRENASKTQMESAIAEFGDRLQEGGVAVLFYSGHGLQVAGHNYLVPVDARIGAETHVRLQAIDADLILEQMAAARSRVNLVLLDACRNNPFERRFRAATGSGLAQMNAPEGTLIAYATAPGKVASDGEGRNGLYTEELLRVIGQPGLPVEQMFKRVRAAVSQRSGGQQTPWESSSLTGEFSFQEGEKPAGPAAGTGVAALTPPTAAGTVAKSVEGPDKEALFWDTIKTSRNPAAFLAYLEQFPHGTFAPLAAIRLDELGAAATEPPGTARSPGSSAAPAPPAPPLPPSARPEPRPPALEAGPFRPRRERPGQNPGQGLGQGQGQGPDAGAPLDKMREHAAAGHIGAQVRLGGLYEHGRGVPQDDAEAARWYRKAADLGDAFAQAALGNLYRQGRGVPQDYGAAFRLFQLSARQGLPLGQLGLAWCLEHGRPGPADPAEAVRLYRAAAASGHPQAQAFLAHAYEVGLGGLPRDLSQARALYLQAARHGNAYARTRLAELEGGEKR